MSSPKMVICDRAGECGDVCCPHSSPHEYSGAEYPTCSHLTCEWGDSTFGHLVNVRCTTVKSDEGGE